MGVTRVSAGPSVSVGAGNGSHLETILQSEPSRQGLVTARDHDYVPRHPSSLADPFGARENTHFRDILAGA